MNIRPIERFSFFSRYQITNSHDIDYKKVSKLIDASDVETPKDKLLKYQIQDSLNISKEAKDEIEADKINKKLDKEHELSNNNVFVINPKEKFVQKQGFVDNKIVFAFNKEKNFETKQLDKLENASFNNLKDYTDLKNDEAFAVFNDQKFVQKQGYFDDRDIFAFDKQKNFEQKVLDEIENASYDNLIDYTDIANDEAFDVIQKDKFVQKEGFLDDKKIFEFNKRDTFEEENLKRLQTASFKSEIDYTDIKHDEAFDVFKKEKFVQKDGEINNKNTFEIVSKPKQETKELNEMLNLSFSNEKNLYDKREDETFVVIKDSVSPQKEGILNDKDIFAFNPKPKQETKELNEMLNLSFSNEKNLHDKREDETFVVIKDSVSPQKEGILNDKDIFAFNSKPKQETKELNEMLDLSFSNEKNLHDKKKDEAFVVIKEKQEEIEKTKLYDKVLKEDKIQKEKQTTEVQNQEKILKAFEDKDKTKSEGKIDEKKVFNADNKKEYEEVQTQNTLKQTTSEDVKNNLSNSDMIKKVDDYIKEISGVDCERCAYLESIGFYDSPHRAEMILLQAISTANTLMIDRINQVMNIAQVKKRR